MLATRRMDINASIGCSLICRFCYHLGIAGDMRYEKDSKGKIIDLSTHKRIRQFPIAHPQFGANELSNVIDCVKTGWISSRGSYIARFEKMFSDYLGGGYPVAVSSGTTALQLGLSALGVGSGHEVIVPNFTLT